jgi:putative transposase
VGSGSWIDRYLSRARINRLPHTPSAAKLDLMKRMDKMHIDHPYMGSRSIQDLLNRLGLAIPRLRATP